MHNANEPTEAKTIGFTPFIYCANQPLFRVNAGVPISQALAQASDLLYLAKAFAEDAAFNKDTDRHAWAAHYLTEMGKAVIDEAVKVLARWPAMAEAEVEE